MPRKVRRIHARQVVPPETHLRDRRQADDEDAPLRQREPDRRHQEVDDRQQEQPRHLEEPQQPAPADDHRRKGRQQDAPAEPAKLLERLHAADRLFLGGARQLPHVRQARDDARHLLDGAEGGRIHARHHDRRHDGRPAELGREQRREAGTPQRAGALLGRQAGDSGRKGRIMMSGIAGITPEISV